MNDSLKLYLEGPGAGEALQDLESLQVVKTGNPVTCSEATKDGWLSLTADILGIASFAATAAAALHRWWQDRRKQSPEISCVIESADGSRINLTRATVDEIAAMLALISRQ